MTLTPEMLKMLRQRAEQDQVLFNPKEILALLDRIEALENCLRSSLQENLGWEDSHWGPEAAQLVGSPDA